ncbi:MAG: UDP-N-acetylmuramate--L-alanine ligase, partial [Paludibacteraceae bacterium]|nr:UDP-N-acetylmuramate--L-alanine ligase [Paludibacteraceae bacterium]
EFVSLIQPNGVLLMKDSLPISPCLQKGVKLYTYSIEKGDFHAENIRIGNGEIFFDFVGPNVLVKDVQLGVPVYVNLENGIAAMAMAWLNGVSEGELRDAMASFAGVKRRFDFHIKTDDLVFLDDYAHHPEELKSSIESVRKLYPDKKLSILFQPHLYSRTKDLADEFSEVLSLADEAYLLDIYPAREEPIEGVTSEMLLKKVKVSEKRVFSKKAFVDFTKEHTFEILLMAGAGDLDLLIPQVKENLLSKI